jgi:hypothetical protein
VDNSSSESVSTFDEYFSVLALLDISFLQARAREINPAIEDQRMLFRKEKFDSRRDVNQMIKLRLIDILTTTIDYN